MNTTFECEQTLLVQADFDGELDAAQTAALIQHEGQCAHCQGVRAQLLRSRELIRSMPPYSVSLELRAAVRKLARAADRAVAGTPSPSRRWFTRAKPLGWGVALAATAVLATLLLRPGAPDVSTQLVANHLRAMELDSHLIDVASSEHHTVKPWFAGKVNFAPLVKQLDADGYVLKGGRVDIVEGSAAAVLVYEAGRHLVDVYMWPAQTAGSDALRASSADGFQLRHWEEGGLVVWCVSDLGEQELDRFAERWRAR